MENTWVDFKAIKQSVKFTQALDHYDITLKRSGKELRGKCPIHQGDGSESFHVNTEKNIFHCFSCQAKGNVLDFVAAMEKCSLREAGQKLQAWFSLVTADQSKPPAALPKPPQLAAEQTGDRGETVNKPLTFRLQGIDHRHPYLAARGIDPETAEYFGIGYFSGRGSMSGRVVIPIENEKGQLIAYAGRAIDGSQPKYRLPAGFKKSQVLYNLAKALEDDPHGTVVLVEGFFDCIKVVESGHVCVALMGCSLSPEQRSLLIKHFRHVIVMLDGDTAGGQAGGEIARALAHDVWVRVIDLPSNKQPDQLSIHELQDLLRSR